MTVTRYHPLLVALHWIIAIILLFQLVMGFVVLRNIPFDDPHKLSVLQIHMAAGTLVLVLMFIRIATRHLTARPGKTESQTKGLGRLSSVVHHLLYDLIVLTAFAGWLTGYAISSLYAKPGSFLPFNFYDFPMRMIHQWSAFFLMTLITVHIAAALHERIAGDRKFLKRVGFGQRKT